MSMSKVTRNFQVTIPASIREMLHVQVGSLVDFIVQKGQVILKPKTLVDEDQAWFWTNEWQQGEKEVERSKNKGEIIHFETVEQMKKHFEK
jgi:AbrB family looped-hinge helix DNA binding protein